MPGGRGLTLGGLLRGTPGSAPQPDHVVVVPRSPAFLQQELRAAGRVLGPCPESPRAPAAREALRVQEQSEQLAQELREVSRNRASLRGRLQDLRQYLHVLREGQRFTSLPVGPGVPADLGLLPRASVSPGLIPLLRIAAGSPGLPAAAAGALGA